MLIDDRRRKIKKKTQTAHTPNTQNIPTQNSHTYLHSAAVPDDDDYSHIRNVRMLCAPTKNPTTSTTMCCSLFDCHGADASDGDGSGRLALQTPKGQRPLPQQTHTHTHWMYNQRHCVMCDVLVVCVCVCECSTGVFPIMVGFFCCVFIRRQNQEIYERENRITFTFN